MAKKPAKPSPVFKIEFADGGQDFTHWYVQNRIVIDCTPFQWRIWCGNRIARMPLVGQQVRFLSRQDGRYLDLKYPVVSIEQLTEEQAAEVIAQWRDRRRELINE